MTPGSWLNHILWLKCRLSVRGQVSGAGTAGTLFLIVFTFVSLIPAAAVVGVYLYTVPERRAEEVLSLTLLAIHLAWISVPVTGYRLNDALDVTRLVRFPVSPVALFTASVLANFIDLSVLLVYPFLVTLVIACSESLASAAAVAGILLLFMIHTFAMGQLLLIALAHMLNMRRLGEVTLILVPPLILGMMLLGEFTYLFAESSMSELYQLDLTILIGFLPPGVVAQAVMALGRGDEGAALYHAGTLAGVTVISLALGALVTDALLRQSGPLDRIQAAFGRLGDAIARRLGRLASAVGRIATRRDAPARPSRMLIVSLAAKEIRLMIREPQIRMALGLYLVGTVALLALSRDLPRAWHVFGLLLLISMGSVMSLAGVCLNGLALERDGLRFLLVAPLGPSTLFVGKNLGQWFVMTTVNTGLVLAGALRWELPTSVILLILLHAQLLIVSLIGLGNLASILVPLKLPTRGVQPPTGAGVGHHVMLLVVASLTTSLAVGVASQCVALVIVPVMVGAASLALPMVPVALLLGLGVWALGTGLAGWLLPRRREKLLRDLTAG